MRARHQESVEILDRFLDELGKPLPIGQVRRTTHRVLDNLARLPEDHRIVRAEAAAESSAPPVFGARWIPATAIASMLIAAVVLVGTLTMPGNGQPIAKRVNGRLIVPGDSSMIAPGQTLRTSRSSGAVLALRDGSHVELGSDVELSIEWAADGIQIDLARGNVIVTAAKQHNGHLYVKTRDCIVSVVGTVFSVKAEATGSRVAVFEGEVHVQHGDVTQTLLPGQQVATNPAMAAIPLQSEIEWSQDSVSHIAMLQQSTIPAAGTQNSAPPSVVTAPGDAVQGGPIIGNHTFYFSVGRPIDAQSHVLTGPAQDGIFRYFNNWNGSVHWEARTPSGGAVLVNPTSINADILLRSFSNLHGAPSSATFSFIYSGIQGRTISFTNDKGATFSYGCADCSFTVLESGIADATNNPGPGLDFKLSPDGSTLSVSCHAAACSVTNLSTNSPGGWQQPPNMKWNARPLAGSSTITLSVGDLLSLPVDNSTGPAGNKQAVIFSFTK